MGFSQTRRGFATARHIDFDLPQLRILDDLACRSFAPATIGRGADLNFIALRLQ